MVDLAGITVVDKELNWIRTCRSQINTQASEMLDSAMDTQNQSQLGTALQVHVTLVEAHK